MINDNVFRPCPMCRTGIERDARSPIQYWKEEEWHVFLCTKNCQSEIWVMPFKGIKKQQGDKTPRWSFKKR